MSNLVTVPNFVAIGQTVVEISRFWIFHMTQPPSWIFNFFYIFNDRNGQDIRTVSLCQILSNSLTPRRRYVSFRFLKMASPLSCIFKILMVGRVHGGRTPSECQISSKSVKPQLRYGDFSMFQDGGRRHLGFLKFQIFNDRDCQEGRTASSRQIASKSVATFRQNRSNRG